MTKPLESLSKAGLRKRLKKIAKEGKLMLVCPQAGCNQVITELHKWSIRHWCCRDHVEIFRLNGNPFGKRQAAREQSLSQIYLRTENLHARGAVTSRAAFSELMAQVKGWYKMYDLQLFKFPPIYCLHCEIDAVPGVLYRNFTGCVVCVPETGAGRPVDEFGKFVMRRQAIDDFIETWVQKHEIVSKSTNPLKVAQRVRKNVYREWLASLSTRFGTDKPFVVWRMNGVKEAWSENLPFQDLK